MSLVRVAVPELTVDPVGAVVVLDVLGLPVVAVDVDGGRVVADVPPVPAVEVPSGQDELAAVGGVVDLQFDRVDVVVVEPVETSGTAATQVVDVVIEPAFLGVPRHVPVGLDRDAGAVGSVAVASGGDVDVVAGIATGEREQKGECAHVNLLMGSELLCHKNARLSMYAT